MSKNILTTILILIIIISFLTRFFLITNLEIEKDEVNFFQTANSISFLNIINNGSGYWHKNHPGFYLVIEKIITNFFSKKISIIRLVNLLFFLINVIFLTKISSFFSTGAKKLFLPVLFSMSNFFIYIDINANPYSLALTFSIISTYYFIKIMISKFRDIDLFLFSFFLSLFLSTSYSIAYFYLCIFPFFISKYLKNKLKIKILMKIVFLTLLFSSFQIIIFFLNLKYFSGLTPNLPTSINEILLNLLTSNFYFLSIIFDKKYIFIIILAVIFLLTILSSFKIKNHKKIFFLKLCFTFIFVPILTMITLNKIFHFHMTIRLLFLSSLGLIGIFYIFLTNLNKKIFNLLTILLFIFLIYTIVNQLNQINKNNTNNKGIAYTMLKTCNNKSFYIINSENYDFYPVLYYYLYNFDYDKIIIDFKNKTNCVLDNLVVFDNRVGKIDISKKNYLEKNNYYFILLSNKISNAEIKKYLQLCSKKTCKNIYSKNNL